MGRFSRGGSREMPELNTSSLPDLIFTILFFFMIVTTMREVTLKVKFTVPTGTELEKLEKKSAVSFIYVGPPTDQLRRSHGFYCGGTYKNDRPSSPSGLHESGSAYTDGYYNRHQAGAEKIVGLKNQLFCSKAKLIEGYY